MKESFNMEISKISEEKSSLDVENKKINIDNLELKKNNELQIEKSKEKVAYNVDNIVIILMFIY